MELFDLYTEQRQPTGKVMVRGLSQPEGTYRLVTHVCIFNSRGEMLIQQRQKDKAGWPGYWDISLGGCVQHGETTQKAAGRELKEELGLENDFLNDRPVMILKFDNGFDDYYLLDRDVELKELQLQPEEVQDAAWASLPQILQMIQEKSFIDYDPDFIRLLFLLHRNPPAEPLELG